MKESCYYQEKVSADLPQWEEGLWPFFVGSVTWRHRRPGGGSGFYSAWTVGVVLSAQRPRLHPPHNEHNISWLCLGLQKDNLWQRHQAVLYPVNS